MKFEVFFDLVRQHEGVEGEAKRHGDLKEVKWSDIPTRWLVMALEHFAVMIHEWNKSKPDVKPEFWIDVKGKAYAELMKRAVSHA